MIQMTPQEKMRWFWTMGEVPGTIFDDLNDRKPQVPGQPKRRQAKRRQLSSGKRQKGISKHNEARIG
jgi:hypothetical protein